MNYDTYVTRDLDEVCLYWSRTVPSIRTFRGENYWDGWTAISLTETGQYAGVDTFCVGGLGRALRRLLREGFFGSCEVKRDASAFLRIEDTLKGYAIPPYVKHECLRSHLDFPVEEIEWQDEVAEMIRAIVEREVLVKIKTVAGTIGIPPRDTRAAARKLLRDSVIVFGTTLQWNPKKNG